MASEQSGMDGHASLAEGGKGAGRRASNRALASQSFASEMAPRWLFASAGVGPKIDQIRSIVGVV